jgi:flagellar basal-body rod modification protein FlgD
MITPLQSAVNSIVNGNGNTSTSSVAGSNGAVIGSNNQSLTQSDFLKLLTTQLTHQDPTNPTDSNAFLNQMAQFSTVSGIQNLLTSFQTLSNSISSGQSLQATGLVGQTVSIPSQQGYLTKGGSVSGDFTLSASTPDAKITITDASKNQIKQIDLGQSKAGTVPFTWDGTDNKGVAVTPGLYTVQATALISGQNTAVATNIQSRVDSVTIGSGGSGLQLNLEGLGAVPFNKVQKII